MKSIAWVPKEVLLSWIKPTPKNYKIKTKLGEELLQMSMKKFGLAGTIVVDPDGYIIDGNSRYLEEKKAGNKKVWVSIPNRKLSKTEYKEMSAMFDYAKAGEVDVKEIKKDLGKTQDFFKDWGMEIPMEMLDRMGAKAPVKQSELVYPEQKGKAGKGGSTSGDEVKVSDIKMVQAFFSDQQEKKFRLWETVIKAKYKLKSTTDVIYKCVELVSKMK